MTKWERKLKWDIRFLELAELVASWGKDPSTKCGAVIVRPDRTVASVGFNGFPRGCNDDESIYLDRDLKLSRVVHAEINAILHAREPLHGYSIYMWWPKVGAATCDRCAAVIIQTGIKEVVYLKGEIPERWKDSCERASHMYQEAGVEVSAL